MALSLNSEEKRVAKGRLSELNGLYREKAQMEALKKLREENIKMEIAQILDIRDKKGNPQPNKVKLPLLMALLGEIYENFPNKKEEEYATMQSYREALNQIPKDTVIGLLDANIEIKGIESDIKLAFADKDDDSSAILPGEVIDAISLIAKDEYKLIKNEELEKAGFKIPDPREPKFDYEEIKRDLIEVLKDE